jgi:hypothetical protein
MYELRYIMVIKFEVFVFKQMLNIFEISGNQIVHANDMEALAYKSVAQM